MIIYRNQLYTSIPYSFSIHTCGKIVCYIVVFDNIKTILRLKGGGVDIYVHTPVNDDVLSVTCREIGIPLQLYPI